MAIGITDNRHYQDMASAMRSKFGLTGTFLPEQMAPAIDGIPVYGGEILEGGGLGASAGDAKRWEVTVVSDTSASVFDLVRDEWISEHWSDANLNVMLTPVGTNVASGQGASAIVSFGRNTPIFLNIYQLICYSNSAGSAMNAASRTEPLKSSTNTYLLRTNADGTIQIFLGSAYLRAGDYTVLAWLA